MTSESASSCENVALRRVGSAAADRNKRTEADALFLFGYLNQKASVEACVLDSASRGKWRAFAARYGRSEGKRMIDEAILHSHVFEADYWASPAIDITKLAHYSKTFYLLEPDEKARQADVFSTAKELAEYLHQYTRRPPENDDAGRKKWQAFAAKHGLALGKSIIDECVANHEKTDWMGGGGAAMTFAKVKYYAENYYPAKETRLDPRFM